MANTCQVTGALCCSLLFLGNLRAAERVDFSYAFGPPHRITIARPTASEKTLLDLEKGAVTASWTYGDLRSVPLAAWQPPRTEWHVRIQPQVDGKPFAQSRWTRGGRYLPMLDNVYEDAAATVRLEAIGGVTGALVRVTARNRGAAPHRISIQCEVRGGWVAHNPSFMTPGRDPDALVAAQHERADRLLLFAVGGDAYPVAAKSMTLEWNVAAGQTRSGWLVRPYAAYERELPALRTQDWDAEALAGQKEWNGLLARATRFDIPDAGVRDAFYASLADLFIMREPMANGYVGGIAGTEVYRSSNPAEPGMTAIALDQVGLHQDAAEGLRIHIDMQEADGEWADTAGWSHHGWGVSGFKAWAAMEHYRLTGDRKYLAAVLPHLAASSRWQEAQRATTRLSPGGVRPATYGLMPRGMGDGGLMNGTDYFGVFYPHNILAVFADRLSAEAATILDQTADAAALWKIYETARTDLLASFEKGAIGEGSWRWIPGTPGLTSGSRWGTLYAVFPAGILDPHHPLVEGTIRKIAQAVSPGGQPINTGWMKDGAWVAVTLDNLAETHLMRQESDQAVAYLYSTLNHATPLYTWCEERGQEPGTTKTAGDRQHLWTPLAVVRFLRDAMVMEQDGELHLALGTARSWLAQGKTVGVGKAPTHFGDVGFRIAADLDRHVLRAEIDAPQRSNPKAIVLHLRHPERARIRRVTVNGREHKGFDADRELVRLPASAGHMQIEAYY
jgi:hypothetical protein